MTKAKIFNLLFSGGNIALPYLLKISMEGLDSIYLVNNNDDITYNGHLYKASTFTYTPANNKGEGGSLEMESADNSIVEFIDAANYKTSIEIVGLLVANNDVQAIKSYKHFYGSVTIEEDGTLSWTLGKDNRLDMVFNPYLYDTDLNRGNA